MHLQVSHLQLFDLADERKVEGADETKLAVNVDLLIICPLAGV